VVGAIETPLADANRFGVIAVDEDRRILSFDEKPDKPMHIPGRPDPGVRLDGHLPVSVPRWSANNSSGMPRKAPSTISARTSSHA
jgi:hypothetical protein